MITANISPSNSTNSIKSFYLKIFNNGVPTCFDRLQGMAKKLIRVRMQGLVWIMVYFLNIYCH